MEKYFEFSTVAYDLNKNKATPEDQREILRAIGWNFYLDQGILQYNKQEPYKIIEKYVRTDNWRPQRDSNSRPLRPKRSALNPLSYGGKSIKYFIMSLVTKIQFSIKTVKIKPHAISV